MLGGWVVVVVLVVWPQVRNNGIAGQQQKPEGSPHSVIG